MIVPRTRLLVWVALLGLPLSALAPFSPVLGLLALLLAVLCVTAAVIDALFARRALEGLTVSAPEIARLFKDRPANLELQIRNDPAQARRLRLGLLWPAEFQCAQEDLLVSLPAGQACSTVSWPCVPRLRGRFSLEKCFIGARSELGLWDVRVQAPLHCELRVYPNLLKERKHVAALFLRRSGWGVRPQRQVGQGREFEKLREYVPGDSLNEIHWKATARRHRPITKTFQIERTQEVYVLLDASRLSARLCGAGDREAISGRGLPRPHAPEDGGATADSPVNTVTFLERYITAALLLGLAAERQGDRFGLLAFTDGVETFLRASQGKQHFTACREALYALQPRTVTPDFNALTAFLRTHLRRRALLVLLTTLDDPVLAESVVRNARLLSRQHVVLVNMPRPRGIGPLFSAPATGVEQIYEDLSGHLLWNQLRQLQQALHHAGVQFSLVDSEALIPSLISQYCSIKERQLV